MSDPYKDYGITVMAGRCRYTNLERMEPEKLREILGRLDHEIKSIPGIVEMMKDDKHVSSFDPVAYEASLNQRVELVRKVLVDAVRSRQTIDLIGSMIN